MLGPGAGLGKEVRVPPNLKVERPPSEEIKVRRTALPGYRSPSKPRTRVGQQPYKDKYAAPEQSEASGFTNKELKLFKQFGIKLDVPTEAPVRGGKFGSKPVDLYNIGIEKGGGKAGKPAQGPNPRKVLTPDEIKILLRIAREKRAKGTYRGVRRPENASGTT
jgi:hypothetical protein